MATSHSPQDTLTIHLKKLMCVCLERAIRTLQGRRMPSPASVHNARKYLKQARAALRLMRNSIGKIEYRRENRRLRAVGLALSGVRDAQVVMATFDRTTAALRPKRIFNALRDRLDKSVRKTREARLDNTRRATIITKLDAEIHRIKRYRAGGPDIEGFTDDARRIYRKGRNSFAHALREQEDKPLHEARKGAKYLSLALRALQTGGIKVSKRAARRADAVAHFLGRDHDLAVLASHLVPLLDDRAVNRRVIDATVAAARRKTRARAFRAGRRLYDRKPKAFISLSIGFSMGH